MRKGEILNLTWERIDLKSRMIRLEPEDTKEGQAKTVPICDEVYRVLTKDNRHIRSSGSENHVIQYYGKPITRNFSTALKTACEKAGIISDMKRHQHFEKPSERKKRKINAAKRKRIKLEKMFGE